MIGFEIIHNNQTTTVGVKDGSLTIHINSINTDSKKDTFIHTSGIEYDAQERKVWQDLTPMDTGDVFEIKVTEIQDVTPPVKSIHDSNIRRPISKLEGFYKLESLLKEKGLL